MYGDLFATKKHKNTKGIYSSGHGYLRGIFLPQRRKGREGYFIRERSNTGDLFATPPKADPPIWTYLRWRERHKNTKGIYSSGHGYLRGDSFATKTPFDKLRVNAGTKVTKGFIYLDAV
jgi:hypothetical protein